MPGLVQDDGARSEVGGAIHCSIQASASLVFFAQRQRNRLSNGCNCESVYQAALQLGLQTTRGWGVTLIVWRWSLPSSVPKRRSAAPAHAAGTTLLTFTFLHIPAWSTSCSISPIKSTCRWYRGTHFNYI